MVQVSSGGSVKGTFHIVTSDGAGPLQALVDQSATGKWSTAKSATVSTQVPGTNGNVVTKRSLWSRALIKMGLITARATNVNEDHVSNYSGKKVERKEADESNRPSQSTSHPGPLAREPSTGSPISASSKFPTTTRTVLSGACSRCRCRARRPLVPSAALSSLLK
jgi:hypothetical protein